MGMNPVDAVKMFMQGAQKQNPNLDPAATAKNMLGDPNISDSCSGIGEAVSVRANRPSCL